MVDTLSMNGELAEQEAAAPAPAAAPPALPELINLPGNGKQRRIPSPGTQRALKAQTGRSYDELCGPAADAADRFQTLIWMKLRKDRPGLLWDDCEDVGVQVEEGAELVGTEVSSPPSSPALPLRPAEPGAGRKRRRRRAFVASPAEIKARGAPLAHGGVQHVAGPGVGQAAVQTVAVADIRGLGGLLVGRACPDRRPRRPSSSRRSPASPPTW